MFPGFSAAYVACATARAYLDRRAWAVPLTTSGLGTSLVLAGVSWCMATPPSGIGGVVRTMEAMALVATAVACVPIVWMLRRLAADEGIGAPAWRDLYPRGRGWMGLGLALLAAEGVDIARTRAALERQWAETAERGGTAELTTALEAIERLQPGHDRLELYRFGVISNARRRYSEVLARLEAIIRSGSPTARSAALSIRFDLGLQPVRDSLPIALGLVADRTLEAPLRRETLATLWTHAARDGALVPGRGPEMRSFRPDLLAGIARQQDAASVLIGLDASVRGGDGTHDDLVGLCDLIGDQGPPAAALRLALEVLAQRPDRVGVAARRAVDRVAGRAAAR